MMRDVNEAEMFVVLKAGDAMPASDRTLMRFGATPSGGDITTYYPRNDGSLSDSFGATVSGENRMPVTDIAQWHVYNVVSKSNLWESRLNGQLQHRRNSNTVRFNNYPLLGSSTFDGKIAEVIIYDRALSEEERIGMQEYLRQKHKLGGAIAPAAPTNLVAYAIGSDQVSLNWEGANHGFVKHEIECREGNGSYVKIGESQTVSFLDEGLKTGVTYSYRVRTVNSIGAGGYSNEAAISLTAGSIGTFAREGMRLWLKADSLPLGALPLWLDEGGQGHHAEQRTSSMRPQVVEDVVTGRRSVQFISSSYRYYNLPEQLMNEAMEGEVFVVIKAAQAVPGGNDRPWLTLGGSTLQTSYYPFKNGSLRDSFGTGTLMQMGEPVNNVDIAQWGVYNVSAGRGTWTARLNGHLQHRESIGAVGFPTQNIYNYLGESFNGEIAEVIIYDRVLSNEERAGMDSYLAQRHQLGFDKAPPTITVIRPLNTTRTHTETTLP